MNVFFKLLKFIGIWLIASVVTSAYRKFYLENKLDSICPMALPPSLPDYSYASRVPAVSRNLHHINPQSGLFSPRKTRECSFSR